MSDPVRESYESSLSWRVTRPLRSAGKVVRRVRGTVGPGVGQRPFTPGRLDSWLEHLAGDRLEAIERACAGGGPDAYAAFRALDTDLWALLLTKEYTSYPSIRALLPDVPDPSLQELWNGASSLRLANQSKTFYEKVGAHFGVHGPRALGEARVLDFGIGWGRLARFFARDVAPGNLCGCDPVDQILDECRRSRVPATLAKSEFVPDRVPFDEPFDLAYSFSVFTHISETAARSCIEALHAGLAPGGILVITVRPPEYLQFSPLMHETLASLGRDPAARMTEPLYLFAPHEAEDSHLQYEGGEMTYGETVITVPYVREAWGHLFELVEVDPLVGDLYQVMLTLRKR